MLQLKKVSINFDGHQIIDDISLNIAKGDVLSIVGESGVGKTTLLRAISGFIDVQGDIYFENEKVIGPGEKLVSGVEGVATIFQDYQLMHNRTVYENIAYPFRAYVEEEQKNLTENLLKILMLDSHRDHYPQQLSGGQKQRVAIARALASEPTLLLLDEPFSNMNVALKEVIKAQLFTYLKNEEITAILVTHEPKDALAISDKIAILKAGHIVQLASPKEVYEAPVNQYVMSCFGHCNFWSKGAFEIDFNTEIDDINFNQVGIRVESLRVTDRSEFSCETKVVQSIYQGKSYLVKGSLKSRNDIYFFHSDLLVSGEKIFLKVNNKEIRYW